MQTIVFRISGGQAIRVPAQFRFEPDTVDVEWDDRLGALPLCFTPNGCLLQVCGDNPGMRGRARVWFELQNQYLAKRIGAQPKG